MSVIEIITDSSINTTTDVGIVNLTQTEPLLCGFITIDTGNVYDLISSACMFMKQFSPYNLRLFESEGKHNDIYQSELRKSCKRNNEEKYKKLKTTLK